MANNVLYNCNLSVCNVIIVIIMNIGIYLYQKRKRNPDCEKKVEDVEKSE